MTDSKTILDDLNGIFISLGRELGFSSPIVQDHGWETHVFMVRNGHALKMEIIWYGLNVMVHVVRLPDGNIPTEYTGNHYPDGSWATVTLDQIYHIPVGKPKKRQKRPTLNTWDEMAPYYFRSLDNQLKLIRNDPDSLINFMDRIDSSPAVPPL